MASVFLENSNYCYFRWRRDSNWTQEISKKVDLFKKRFYVLLGGGG